MGAENANMNASEKRASESIAPEIQIAPDSGDVALELLKATGPADISFVLDKETTSRVLRKIDRVMLPIMA
jgi:hypothetical protein